MDYEEIFTRVAHDYNIDKHILIEQARQESRLDPLAVGAAGDMGLMQILPKTWDEWAPKVGVYDPFDPESNLSVAAAYMVSLRTFLAQRLGLNGNHWMLVAYNWGPGNVQRLVEQGGGWEDVPENRRNYALDILMAAEARALAVAEPYII